MKPKRNPGIKSCAQIVPESVALHPGYDFFLPAFDAKKLVLNQTPGAPFNTSTILNKTPCHFQLSILYPPLNSPPFQTPRGKSAGAICPR